jgi:hypothetical protein
MSDEATVEIPAIETPTPEAPTAPSRDDLKVNGWSPREIEAAEKRGMIPKAEVKEAPKPEATVQTEPKAEAPKEEKKPVSRGTMPDFNMTPEQEKVFLDTFPAGTSVRGVYFRMKNERHARQALEAQVREQQAQIEALKSAPKAAAPKEVDDQGNEIDPDDKPLTPKMLREMQQREAEEAEKRQREMTQRARALTEAQQSQEEYARSIYTDFDDTVNKAKEVLQNLNAIPEKWKQAKAVKLAQELQVAAAQADKLGLDDYNAALIAYELGQLHPDYSPTHGQRADTDGNPNDPKKANGGLTPEQMKRIEENTQRRASSASIPGGGGSRKVTADEVTANDLNRMSSQDRQKFRQKYPDRYEKLLRG